MLRGGIRILRLATAFLTRIPGIHPREATADDFTRAHAVFPLVGLGIGTAIASVQIACGGMGLPRTAGAALALGAGMLLTGALHEDGLADTIDGLGGGRDRASKLDIMRDSRVGTYGALALVVIISLKIGAIAYQEGLALIGALALAHAASRSATTVMARLLPAARADGLSASAGMPPLSAVSISVCTSLVASLLILPPFRALAVVAVTAVITAVVALIASRAIGGQTGDVLGANQQLAEAAILLTIVARPAWLS